MFDGFQRANTPEDVLGEGRDRTAIVFSETFDRCPYFWYSGRSGGGADRNRFHGAKAALGNRRKQTVLAIVLREMFTPRVSAFIIVVVVVYRTVPICRVPSENVRPSPKLTIYGASDGPGNANFRS